ncbi:hypothetical protein RE432_18395 [Pusillimonas sp. SM2304]|uniref:hypothetical protein n=1 Tax=Pusillimonas sp. SM2304 TaxID=3073241 RepID=UPI002876C99E|nr:hypothetical protein [Pusillimonas sp. SM2304]MDS1142408.1 hypothetical protein [Pusillimonas sp. SM2304]
MRGQETIIRMRINGYKPSLVWLLVLQNPCPRSSFLDAEQVVQNGGHPEIQVGSDDIPGTLDLRALTGLTVLLQGVDINRLRLVYARLKEFDPARIITSSPDFIHEYERKAA